MSQPYAEAMDMRVSVSYKPYAKSFGGKNWQYNHVPTF